MQFKQPIACGVLAVFVSIPIAEARNVFGVTSYSAPGPATVAPPPAASPPLALTGALAPVRHHRFSHRALTRVAANAIEVVPAPTPNRAPQDTDATTVPQTVKDGPHEQPAPTLSELITKHAKENGVPPALATAVVRIESRFNPNARGGSAIGLMQIKVDTARSLGFAGGAAGLLRPDTNLHFGMKVLADAYRASNGNLCMTLARYQSGHRVTRMSAANRAYCARARQMMAKA